MKKHFLKSFALLAMLFSALTMSAASGVDWSAYEFLGDGAGGGTYSNKYKISTAEGMSVVNIQIPGFTQEPSIYATFPAGISDCNVSHTIQGAGIALHISGFTAQETEVIVNYAGGSCTFWVYYADGTEDGGEGGEDPVDPTPDPEEPEVTDKWANVDWVEASDNKYKVSHECLTNVVNVQQPGWAAEKGIYVTAPAGISSCTVNGAIDGAGMILYLSSFTAKETEVTITHGLGSCTFWVYYADGTEGGGETPSTPTEIYDVNFALASNGSSAEATSGDATAAIDNNAGTRWESAQADPQTWILDLGQARIFNTLEIVWEGAYGKTFTVSASDDKENWTPIWTVEGQELAGFPYTQTQKIDKTTARYIQFHGTERGTGYGYSFWEFRVYLAGESTFTSLEATPTTNLSKVGEGNAITLTAKDQNGQVMADAGEVTYTITPADAGTITNNIYTPAKIGLATIVATIGEVSAPAFEVFAYDGENVALSPDINNSKIVAQSAFAPSGTDAWHAIDGNEGSVWQGSATNGTTDDETSRTYDSWFVVDFGAEYDVNLVSINFEGACSQEYHVDFSADNATWSLAYNYVGNAGVNGHTKLIYGADLQNTNKVRYARFYSTKAATQWGVKMFEFKVYGTESATLTKAVSASVNDAAMGTATVTQNGVDVTEVETGSEVIFTAIANEGYAFVNWSNGNTNPSFTTTVDAAMNLTANFRALGNIYCNTEMTVDGHTIYVTMKRSAPETYQLIVRSEENLTNFGGTNFYRPNNVHVINLRNQGVLSDDKHILTATFNAETIPYMVDPLFVIFEGNVEKTYPKLDNIEYDVECSEDVTITGLALNPASVSIMVGGSQTLKPLFTPAHAFTNELEWTSSDETIVTVDANGVVTAVAEGEAVITATLVSNSAISATCNVTVTAFTAHSFYGNGDNSGVDFAYSLTNNANGTVTIVADVLTNNPGLGTISFSIDDEWKDMTKNADGTYTRTSEKTFSVGQKVHCFLYAPYTDGVGRLDFDYIIGSSNERPNVAVTSVTLDKTSGAMLIGETLQLTAIFNPGTATNKAVSWSSDNTTVAEVNANGLVTAKAEGTATITVTTADGGKTAQCIVTVSTPQVRTWWGTGKVTINGHDVDIIYSITHNLEKTLTYTVIFGDDTDMVREVNESSIDPDVYHPLTGFESVNKTASWTSTATHTSGEVITGFFWLGGNAVNFTYVVGSVNERPSLTVESVALNHTSYNLLVNETVQLAATITPGTAANKSVTWSSNNNAVATVDENGLVTAKSSGSATITVTTVDGNKTATCTINVIASLTETIYYDNAFFKAGENYVGVNYSITRTTERKLRYEAVVHDEVVGLVMQFSNDNGANYNPMPYDAATQSYVCTLEQTFDDGTIIDGFFYPAFDGGADRWNYSYTVGSTNSPVLTMVGINDQEADQTTRLAQYTSPVDVVLARAITPDDDWFTISLPFALNATQITEIFGDGTQVLKLAKAGVAPDQVTELGFSPVNAIQAATPYLIKPTKKVNAGTVLRNITLATTSNPVKVSNVTMHPLLNQIEYDYTNDNVLFFLGTDNLLYYQATDNKLLGLRAYFTFDDVTTYPQAAQVRARVVFNENETTDLDNLITTDAPVKVIENGQLIIIRDGIKYNVQGQKL